MLSAAASKKHETIAEMASSLLCFEGEKIEVMSNTKEGKHISFNMTIPRLYSSIVFKLQNVWLLTYI